MTVFELALSIALGYSGGMLLAAVLQAAINASLSKYYNNREMKKFNEAIAKLNEHSESLRKVEETEEVLPPKRRTTRKKTGDA
jgi:hypothetical protein